MKPAVSSTPKKRTYTFTLAEFLQKHAPDYELPKLQRTAIVHGHCHEKAVLNFDCEKALLKKRGLELKCPDTGCCGMAGAFGFEKKHLDVSLACGERVLLPAVRQATRDTLMGNLPEQKYTNHDIPMWSAAKAFLMLALAVLGPIAIARQLGKARRTE